MKLKIMPYFTSSQIKQLKWIGLGSMVLDHIAVIFESPDLQWLRIIGRSAFLIFGFIVAVHLAQGNGNIKKYALRMLCWALLSQLPYQWAFNDKMSLNILFQFFAVIIYVSGWGQLSQKQLTKQLSGIGMIILAITIAMTADYQVYGFVYCLFCYLYVRHRPHTLWKQIICFIGLFICVLNVNATMLITYLQSDLFPFVIIAMGLTLLALNFHKLWSAVTAEKAFSYPKWQHYFFYVFYPTHLLLLYAGKIYLTAY